jgi:hypothetical protein
MAKETERDPITRDTPIHFGKHKGVALREIPDSYLKWYRDNGEFDDWVTASFEELKHRRNATDERPADKPVEREQPEPDGGGKRYLDSIIIAFEYTMLALKDLGHNPSPDSAAIEKGAWVQALIEASQKIAVTAAIQAEKQGLDLEAELRATVSERWNKRNPQPKIKDKDDDLPI